jgi:spermidine/putrescine transport system substrate-binding protein
MHAMAEMGEERLREALETPLSRRTLLRRGGQVAGLAGIGAFLAACSGSSATTAPSQAAATGAAPSAAASAGAASAAASAVPASAAPAASEGPLGTILNFANWPAYIDVATSGPDKGKNPSLLQFTAATGVKVNYQEKIDDNNSFVATIRPQLKAGLDTGWDLMVLTDWMAAQLVGLGWISKINKANVQNCVANLRDALRNLPWDPNNDYHYTWQSGMTGVGYSKKSVAAAGMPPLTKLADLWNSKLAGHVTFLTEMRDTFGLGMLKLGIDPATCTIDDVNKVVNDMQPLVSQGLRFTGNSYLQDFANGKVWAAMVWSGDLASSGSADDVFVFPDEGTMIWSDNMLIPKGAQHQRAAEAMMNWVYDPKIAAEIEDYVYYVCPVKGADVEIKKLDPPAATNPLIFPTQAVVAKQHAFKILSADEDQQFNDAFNTLMGS